MPALNPQPIVCGTDFSEAAQHAAEVAAMLARRTGGKCLLVRGIDERAEIPPRYWRRLKADDQPRVEEEAERLRAKGFAVEGRVLGAVPDDGVARCAESADARMIVVASSEMGAIGRALVGSVSERIAETAWVPTLVVRDHAVLEAWLREARPLKVFVAADFTPTSDAALHWAKAFAEIAPCAITVGFVDREADERGAQAMKLPAGAPPAPEMQEMLTHDLREKARVLFGPHDFQVHVLAAADRVDLRLLDLAREAGAELIVVGTHQWHGLSRLRHASVSRRILHESNTNVACVPARSVAHGANAAIPAMRRVLVATDLSPHGGHAVPYAFSILAAGGTVQLVHIADRHQTPDERLSRLRALIPAEAANRGIEADAKVIEHPDVAAAICEAAENFQADVICLGSHGHGGILSSLMGSVASAVLARSLRPVLVVRPPML